MKDEIERPDAFFEYTETRSVQGIFSSRNESVRGFYERSQDDLLETHFVKLIFLTGLSLFLSA